MKHVFLCLSLFVCLAVLRVAQAARPSPPFNSDEYWGCMPSCHNQGCPQGNCTDMSCSDTCYNLKDDLTWCYTPNYASATCGLVCETGYSVGPGPKLGYPTCLCAPGYGNDGTTSAPCVACSSGYYKPIARFAPCTACPSNSASSGQTRQSFASGACNCNAGYYGLSSSSSTACTACPSGTYKSSSGNSASCTSCPAGSTSTGTTGSTYANAACTCAAGYYGLDSVASTACTVCSSGTFKSLVGNGVPCQSCPANAEASGLTGQTSAEGACTCQPGYGYSVSGSSMLCSFCPSGYYKNLTANSACLPAPLGYFTNGTDIFTCSNNTYYNSTLSNTTCVPLPDSTVSDGNLGYTCPPQEYLDSSTTSCLPCPRGSYRDGLGKTCFTCNAGLEPSSAVVNGTAVTVCTAPAGMTWNETLGAAVACPEDSFKATFGNESCSLCGVNFTTDGKVGQTSAQACACPGGHYLSYNTCQVCGVDTFKSWGNGSQCIACTWGTSTNGTIGASGCSLKANTQYNADHQAVCLAGYEPTAQDCTPCESGFFKDEIGNSACVECSTATTRGATTCIIDGVDNKTASLSASQSGNSGMVVAIAASTGGVLLAVAVTAAAVVALKRSRKNSAAKVAIDPKMRTAGDQLLRSKSKLMEITARNLDLKGGAGSKGSLGSRSWAAQTMLISQPNTRGTFALLSGTTTKFADVAIAYPAFLEIDGSVGLRKLSQLSKGGFGVIFKAEIMDVELKSTLIRKGSSNMVALKILNGSGVEGSNVEDEFMNEAAVMYACQFSPFVVRLLAVTRNPECGIVMKLCEGSVYSLLHHSESEGLLKDMLKAVNNNYSALVSVLAYQLSCALADLHSIRVVHLDIKPANVLIEYSTDTHDGLLPFKVMLTDFGISRATNRALIVKGMSTSLVNGLSLNYSAPESFSIIRSMNQSESTVEPETLEKMDIFSFGSTVYEMLSKKVPFTGMEAKEIETSLITGQRPSWDFAKEESNSSEDKSRLASLRQVVDQCWVGHPSKRPNAAYVNEQLEEISKSVRQGT